MITGAIDPQKVDIDFIKKRAEEVGKTNLQWNVYQAVLDWCKEYEQAGLTPVVYTDIMMQSTMVTSQEHIDGKLH